MEGHVKKLTELALSNGAQQSSDFNTILDFYISYCRSDIGRNSLANLRVVPLFLSYLSSIIDHNNNNPQEKTNNYKLICSILKILRNLCAGEITNQSSFIHDGGLNSTASLANLILPYSPRPKFESNLILPCSSDPNFERNLTSPCSSNPNIEVNLSQEAVDVCQMILQLLGNVCLAGEEQQLAVWRTFFPDIFQRFACIRNIKVYEPLCMVICTCCKDSQERLKELCGNAGCPVFAGLLRTSLTVGVEGDWLELLLTKIYFEETYFEQLFSSLRSQECPLTDRAEDEGEKMSLEQASLLHAIANFATNQMEEFSRLVNSRECKPVLRRLITFLVEIVQKSERSIVIDSLPANPPTLPTGLPALDVLSYSLNILRDVCACEDTPFSTGTHQTQETGTLSIADSLISSHLIQSMIHLLLELGPPEAVKKATMQANAGSSNSSLKDVNQSEGMAGGINRGSERKTSASICMGPSLSHNGNRDEMAHVDQIGKACPYKGYRRDIVSVLANAAFRRKHIQDQLRECGGLFLLLQQCVVDEKNPFLREWGLWAIRNLLEDNRENQREVSELELQNSVNTPAIAEMGLRVEIDPSTRKPKLVNLAT